MVNRSVNVSQSPVPRRLDGDNSLLANTTDASGYKNRADEDSIAKKIIRNKLKEVEEAGYPNREKKSSIEPNSETRNYGARAVNTSYTAVNTSTLRETMKSKYLCYLRCR
jgi:hypothetical protein